MKITKTSYISLLSFLVFLAACSTKRDKWANRNFQALNTKYNVLYNGNLALTDGKQEVISQYRDDFWQVLPVERMQFGGEKTPDEAKNKNFQRAEEKATKAIQKRSMHIDGRERNSQIDEAYLLLGKSRYYDKRFIPALEAFNYILYKNPDSDKIHEAKIWVEKTNMRLGNDAQAVTNLNRLLGEIKFGEKALADANATLAQAYLNEGDKNKGIVHLQKAISQTKVNEEKARYRFILGQLYAELGKKDSAFAAYQSVIDMKRKSPRVYVVQAHGEQSKQFDFKKGDTLAFTEKYRLLFKDRENRPFTDVLNYQMGLYYDQKNSDVAAIKFYNRSLKAKPTDKYLVASNYKNLAKIHFDNAKYIIAGKYYDSTLVNLEPRTREYNFFKRKRENLDDVIKYEGIAQKNDSILSVLAMSETDKKKYYETYISKIKKADEAKAALKKAAEEKEKAIAGNSAAADYSSGISAPPAATPPTPGQDNTFYFYNPSTVAYGKVEFKKKWGDRPHTENWRLSSGPAAINNETAAEATVKEGAVAEEAAKEKSKGKEEKAEYTTDFYTEKLPSDQKEIETLTKDRNFAYYQLGLIYKEKFTEYQLAADKLERLLTYNPEERLVLPSMYHLYKIYDIIDKNKALAMKNRIIEQYPDSRYASILKNEKAAASLADSPEVAYNNLYKVYEEGDYFKVLDQASIAIDQFAGEEIVPKFELLKANTIGKLKGVSEYKNALNFVALNYPNSSEGKEAEALVSKNIPQLEALNFSKKESKNWNILYQVTNVNDAKTKALLDKIKKFTTGRTIEKLSYSVDIYNMTESFIVIHGISSEPEAKNILTILTDYKDYRITEPAIIISSENYAVVQIKKNLNDYLGFAKPAPIQDNSLPQNGPNKTEPGMQAVPSSIAAPAQEKTQPADKVNKSNLPQQTVVPTPVPQNAQSKPGPASTNVPSGVVPPPAQEKTPASNKSVQPVNQPLIPAPPAPPMGDKKP